MKKVTAHLTLGTAVGQDVGEGVCCFSGLPFATPPVGANRWRRPRPPEPWEGHLDCTRALPSVRKRFQKPVQFVSEEVDRVESEDCLYAQVWAPLSAVQGASTGGACATAPVVVYINGGGLVRGWVGDPDGSPEPYTHRGVISVQGNYRHGPLGFMQPHGGDANCGLWDQVALLQWVRAEVHAFGGDANNITVHGQSGGADLALALCCSPVANHYFKRAIIESPSALTLTAAQANEVIESFAAAAGTKTAALEDLAKLTVSQVKVAFKKKAYRFITASAPGMAFAVQTHHNRLPIGNAPGAKRHSASGLLQCAPCFAGDPAITVDGELVPERPLDAIANGAMAHLDVIIGSNRGEAIGDLSIGSGGIKFLIRRFAWEFAVAPFARGMSQETLRCHTAALVAAYEAERDHDPLGLVAGRKCGHSPAQQILNFLYSDLTFGVYTQLAAEQLATPGACRHLYRVEFLGTNGTGGHHGDGFLTVGDWDEDKNGSLGSRAHSIVSKWQDAYAGFAATGNPNRVRLAGNTIGTSSEFWRPCIPGGGGPVTSWDLQRGASLSRAGVRVDERRGFRKLLVLYARLWGFKRALPIQRAHASKCTQPSTKTSVTKRSLKTAQCSVSKRAR